MLDEILFFVPVSLMGNRMIRCTVNVTHAQTLWLDLSLFPSLSLNKPRRSICISVESDGGQQVAIKHAFSACRVRWRERRCPCGKFRLLQGKAEERWGKKKQMNKWPRRGDGVLEVLSKWLRLPESEVQPGGQLVWGKAGESRCF